MKCQICRNDEATWSWQPWGPHGGPLSFALKGGHYKGWPAVKLCQFCKRVRIENIQESGVPLRFQFKGQEYVFDGKRPPFEEYLWNGGTSSDGNGGDVEMICRYTPTGHDIVAIVYTDDAPGLADEIIKAYNNAHGRKG